MRLLIHRPEASTRHRDDYVVNTDFDVEISLGPLKHPRHRGDSNFRPKDEAAFPLLGGKLLKVRSSAGSNPLGNCQGDRSLLGIIEIAEVSHRLPPGQRIAPLNYHKAKFRHVRLKPSGKQKSAREASPLKRG